MFNRNKVRKFCPGCDAWMTTKDKFRVVPNMGRKNDGYADKCIKCESEETKGVKNGIRNS